LVKLRCYNLKKLTPLDYIWNGLVQFIAEDEQVYRGYMFSHTYWRVSGKKKVIEDFEKLVSKSFENYYNDQDDDEYVIEQNLFDCFN